MINIIGLAFIIIVAVFAYKTAKDYGRSAIGWALIALAVGFGIQIILPIFIIIIVTFAMLWRGAGREQILEDIPTITITVTCIVLSVIAGFLILRHLSKMPEEQSFILPPEPPETFN